MIKAGLTGIMGSGKSTAARIFEVLGVPVFNADQAAKNLYSNPDTVREVITAFGSDILDDNHRIDFGKLSNVVFKDKTSNETINRIIHPKVKFLVESWFTNNSNYPMAIYESALLFESGFYELLDWKITVTAPLELCLQRIRERSNLSDDEILQRMSFQYSDEKKRKLSDAIIYNDEKQMLLPQVLRLYKSILKNQAPGTLKS